MHVIRETIINAIAIVAMILAGSPVFAAADMTDEQIENLVKRSWQYVRYDRFRVRPGYRGQAAV